MKTHNYSTCSAILLLVISLFFSAVVAGPAPGHAFPAAGLAVALRRRGHDVVMFTGPDWRCALQKELSRNDEPSTFSSDGMVNALQAFQPGLSVAKLIQFDSKPIHQR